MNRYPVVELHSLGPFQLCKIASLSPILHVTNSTLLPPLTNDPSLCNLQSDKDSSAGTARTLALVYYCTKSMEGKPIAGPNGYVLSCDSPPPHKIDPPMGFNLTPCKWKSSQWWTKPQTSCPCDFSDHLSYYPFSCSLRSGYTHAS